MQQPSIIATRVRLDDVDQATEYMRAAGFGHHDRVQLGKGTLGLELQWIRTPHVSVGSTSVQAANVVRAAVRSVTVHVPVDSRLSYRVGRRTLSATPTTAAILVPGHEYTLHNPGSMALALIVAAPLLQDELEARRKPLSRPLATRCVEARLAAGTCRAFHQVQRQFARVAESPRGRDADSSVATIERSAAAWLACRMLDSAGQLAASPASLQLADDIDRWIRMHIAEPITLDRLVAAAAVSPRTLQLACLARWGRSPMELLTHRRLELARSMLQSSQPGMLVTHAALRSGFSHLGRFAGQYKQFYGESPSETLERSVAGVRASRPAASADSTDPA